jgi:CheY-like chemotaxis protein
LKWLRENSKCSLLPIMVLSTSLHEGDIQQAYKLGANAYLAKPSTLTEYEKLLQVFYDFWAQCQKPALDGI